MHMNNKILDTLLGDPERRKEYFDENSKFYIFDRNRNAFSSILLFYQSKEGFQTDAGSLNIWANGILRPQLGQWDRESIFFKTYLRVNLFGSLDLSIAIYLSKNWYSLD